MKKSKRYNDYYDDDEDYRMNKKKVREEKARKAKRNEKNLFKSKSFDPVTYNDKYEEDY